MEQVKGVVREHLEKHKFFDSLKTAVAKDPKLNKLDRNQIIEKLKQEGILGDILQSIPHSKKQASASSSTNDSTKLPPAMLPGKRKTHKEPLDPNRRYLSCNVIKGAAFVDFVNVRQDEQLQIAVSFLKNRCMTKQVGCSTDPVFDETFMFDFQGDEEVKFDAATLLKLNQPLHITIIKHRKNEKPVVLGTKTIDWRPLLYCNQVEVNAEVLPVSLAHQGSLGVLTMHLDLVPALNRTELLSEEQVDKQINLEKKFEHESV